MISPSYRRAQPDRIDGLQAVLARLDWKLDGYEERMVKCEENLR